MLRFATLLLLAAPLAAQTVGFEGLPPGSFRNDAGPVDGDHFFTEAGANFNNTHGVSFGFEFWSGWSLSNVTNNATGGFGNQYASITGGGSQGTAGYGVAFVGPTFIDLPAGLRAAAIDLTNTAYAYFSMLNGDAFARQFAAGDFFTLTINGHSGAGGVGPSIGSIDFALADFTNGNTRLLNVWETVDLSSLAAARSLSFTLASSDVGMFGINTPTYFAADNLVLVPVPEPGTLGLLAAAALAYGIGTLRTRRRKASA